MAVIKTSSTENLAGILYDQILGTMQAPTFVQVAAENAIEQITGLSSKEPVPGATNKLISASKSITLTETIKGAVSQDSATVNGTNKIALTGAGLNPELTTGTITGLVLSGNTTDTTKAPAFLSTANYVDTLTARVDLNLAAGTLSVGDFTASQTEKYNIEGYSFPQGAPLVFTANQSSTLSVAFAGSAVYVEGNKLQSTIIKSFTLKTNAAATSGTEMSSSYSDAFALSSKAGLKITADEVTGLLDSLNFSRKMATRISDLNLEVKVEEAYQATSLGNTAGILSEALSYALVANHVMTAQAAVEKASEAAEKAALLADQTGTAEALAALEAANNALTAANSALVHAQEDLGDLPVIDTQQVKQDLAAELFKGNDTITVTSIDTSLIHGGAGDDRITGNIGSDDLYGDAGDDTINGDKGSDRLQGGQGSDKLYGGDGADTLYGDEGNDLLDGGSGNDYLYGGDGNDTLLGGTGNDWLEGDSGNDSLDGGAGHDVLLGGEGNDLLKGGAGNDVLLGGVGQDTLTGGAGLDLFIFQGGDSNIDSNGKTIDTITDFNVNEDTIAFNHLDFDLDSNSVKTLTIGNGAKATYASLLIEADKLFSEPGGSVKAVIGYDGGNAYVFVDTDDVVGADTAIKLVGVKTQAAINAIKLIDVDYTFSQA